MDVQKVIEISMLLAICNTNVPLHWQWLSDGRQKVYLASKNSAATNHEGSVWEIFGKPTWYVEISLTN